MTAGAKIFKIFGKSFKNSCVALIATAALCGPAAAQQLGDCDWRASAAAIAEPWETNIRAFANGDTRVAVMDTIEPGSGPIHLLILSPPFDELGSRSCRILSMGDGFGFYALDFAAHQAKYDPALGLVLSMPAQVYDPVANDVSDSLLTVTINQGTGDITTTLSPAP